MPGTGWSSPTCGARGRNRTLPPPYTAVQHADDLARLLDHLGIDSTAVLGASQRGTTAQQFARAHADRCTRLVLRSTFAHNMATHREWIEGQVAPPLLRLLGPRRFASSFLTRASDHLDREQRDRLVDLMAAEDRDLMLVGWKELLAFDSRPWLDEIRCPTLVVAGSEDVTVPIHHAYMLRDGIPGARLTVIEGADHVLIWTHMDEFLRLVDEFLDE